MVHPMYNIDAELQKYPLFGKALEATESEVEGAVFWSLGEMGSIALPKNIIRTVENNIDGSDAEKQAIMIGVLFMLAPEALATTKCVAHEEYDGEVAAVLSEMAVFYKQAASNQQTVLPMHIARVQTALTICISTGMMPLISRNHTMSQNDIEAALKAEEHDFKNFVLPNLNAPRLSARYQKTKQDLCDAMIAPVLSKNTQGRKPTGPR